MIYSYNTNQRDAISSNLYLYRTLHVSEKLTVHHQESSIVYTETGICYTGYADCLHAKSS
jgi:hypothetical protein